MTEQWFKNGMNLSSKEMVTMINHFIMDGVSYFIQIIIFKFLSCKICRNMLFYYTNPLRYDKECFEVEGKEQFPCTVLDVLLRSSSVMMIAEAFTKRK